MRNETKTEELQIGDLYNIFHRNSVVEHFYMLTLDKNENDDLSYGDGVKKFKCNKREKINALPLFFYVGKIDIEDYGKKLPARVFLHKNDFFCILDHVLEEFILKSIEDRRNS